MNEKIEWLDGKSADGMYVLSIEFKNGRFGFLKNHSLDKINNWIAVFKSNPDIYKMTVNYPAVSEAA